MTKVYIVSKISVQSGGTEGIRGEQIVKVFDSYDKTVSYLLATIKKEHEEYTTEIYHNALISKHEPNPNRFSEGKYIRSYDFDTGKQRESVYYRYVSREVE